MTNRGFTLIEIAVVLVLVGLVTSAGLILLPKLWQEKQRIEARKYLLAAKASLLTYATEYNALPVPDAPDPLPTVTLKLKQRDSFDQPLRYIVNSNLQLGADKTLPCKALKEYSADAYLAGRAVADFPHLWQYGMPKEAGAGMPVAAVLISRGADGVLGKYFTEVGVNFADNSTNDLVQAPVSETFDDLIAYLTIPEVMDALPECRQ